MIETPRLHPTLQAVADAAGVHRSTASRALNPQTAHLVADDVAERIQAAARRLGYRRDAMAAGLRTKHSHLVGIAVPDMANLVFAPILCGIEDVLAKNGYSALIANTGSDVARQIDVVDQLIGRRVEGLILATVQQEDDPVLTRCLEARVPTVLVNRAEARHRAPAVISDDLNGMRIAVEHLIGLGHRRIGHLAGPQNLSTGVLRLQGFREAMERAGLDASAVMCASAYSREAGAVAGGALLDRFGDLTAVAAANDLLALGLYGALGERGLSCPADVSVVGHNDMPLVDMVSPPLTSVRIRHQEMGAEAARLLLEQMSGAASGITIRVTPPELIVRGSTGRRAARSRKAPAK
ncbi:LacI family DNA-binding transcriptional regulator [Xanthobacter sp. V7C-4]